MELLVPILIGLFFFVITIAIAVLIYLDRISKDTRLVQQLFAAYVKRTVAGAVADHELADVVREAEKLKAPAPAGVAR